MNLTHALASARSALRNEMGHLTRMNHSDRPWQMPLAAALATGLPLVVGACFGRMDFGLVSSIGGWPSSTCRRRRCTTAWCSSWPAPSR